MKSNHQNQQDNNSRSKKHEIVDDLKNEATLNGKIIRKESIIANKPKRTKSVKSILVAFAVILSIIAVFFGSAIYLLSLKDVKEISFYEYAIRMHEINISPETYTGDYVEVSITIDNVHFTEEELKNAGLSIEYKVGDNDTWTKYTGPFAVRENTKITARFVAEDFEGPITEKDIKNIAVAKIGDKYYKTLQEAIDDCPDNAGDKQTKIEMLFRH